MRNKFMNWVYHNYDINSIANIVYKMHDKLNYLNIRASWLPETILQNLENKKKIDQFSAFDVKFLEYVEKNDGDKYFVGTKRFDDLDNAIEFCNKMYIKNHKNKYIEKLDGIYLHCIMIYNENNPGFINSNDIPKDLTIRNAKEFFSKIAIRRYIYLPLDLREVYMESFEIYDDKKLYGSSSNQLYDYGYLYGNYPRYDGTQICTSKDFNIFKDDSMKNIIFVPEPIYDDDLNKKVEYNMDICVSNHCWFIRPTYRGHDGSHITDDVDGAFPYVTIPVGSYINLGKNASFFDEWDKVDIRTWEEINSSDQYIRYSINPDMNDNTPYIRQILMDLRFKGLEKGKCCYEFYSELIPADGIIPKDLIGQKPSLDMRNKLLYHVQKRKITMSPNMDELYFEEFELKDEEGTVYSFRFDYSLMYNSTKTEIWLSEFRTTYWNKIGLPGENDNKIVEVISMPRWISPTNMHMTIVCKDEKGNQYELPACTLIPLE